ncbi:uncharacterized protein LOC129457218 [Periophthalmus magnuspinnatus]|uniref:uncharacterized protein LOC129457218 n=1 Tax=Periophthalmus magnuspinnatus TaxID=409849 RepID=UPI00243714DA|nr:uncharacterized protein LOC129457218 [Periophthalmus magnuspinnatus]
MNAFTFLLCVLMHEVTGQIKDISPARILVPQRIVSENSNLHVICSTFGFKKNTPVYVYLCNNGTGVERLSQKPEENDSTFTLTKVTPTDSGEYSCVHSISEYKPDEVNATGINSIGIHVLANFQPANLTLSSPSSVSQGAKVEFVCSLPYVLQTLDDCGSVQSYLMRDRAIYQVQGFDVKQREARFVIQDAVQKDSGLYSCVVRPSQCFKDAERLTGNNAVILQVQKG